MNPTIFNIEVHINYEGANGYILRKFPTIKEAKKFLEEYE